MPGKPVSVIAEMFGIYNVMTGVNVKYKLGDKIRIRHLKAIARQFFTKSASSSRDDFKEVNNIIKANGRVLTIEAVTSFGYITKEIPGCNFTDEMIESIAFEYGELIEVSSDENFKHSHERIFVVYMDGSMSPFNVALKDEFNDEFFSEERYRYARKIQPKEEPEKDKQEKTYCVGDKFKYEDGDMYMLCRIDSNTVSLCNMDNGERWANYALCKDPRSITRNEIEEIIGSVPDAPGSPFKQIEVTICEK